MPAPDLTSVHERLTYPWYSKLMHDPASINPGTRMPAFWTGDTVAFKEIAGGTPQGQIDAMWAYMSLGRSMALPAGLQPIGGGKKNLVALFGGEPRQLPGSAASAQHLDGNVSLAIIRGAGHWVPWLRG